MNKNKKSGFTLIELLAVIIILGILLVIAVPSVTSYISGSRKSAYVNTAKELIGDARNFVNQGNVKMYDTDTTYFIDYRCIKTETGTAKSPYGDFVLAYVGVTYDGSGYKYYWTSVDETGHGIKELQNFEEISEDSIMTDVKESDIAISKKLEDNSKYIVINENCEAGSPKNSEVEACVADNPRLSIARGYWPSVIPEGDIVTIEGTVTGLGSGCESFIVWQYTEDNTTWIEIDPDTNPDYYVTNNYRTLNIVSRAETLNRGYRATLYYR